MYSTGGHESSLFYEAKRIKVHVKIPPPKDHFSPPCLDLLYKAGYYAYHYTRRSFQASLYVDDEIEELDTQLCRYKPESIEQLQQTTKFSRNELKSIYRDFKHACPTGFVDFSQFKDIFAKLFPRGDCTAYAKLVFNSFPKEVENQICFEEFVGMLSTLLRGTTEEKLSWAFRMYDTDNDGFLTKNEVYAAVRAMYDLAGGTVQPPMDDYAAKDHAADIFNKLDTDEDSRISFEEFMEVTKEDNLVCESLVVFDTVL